MDERGRAVVAAGGTGVLFVLVQVGALAVVEPFAGAGFRPPSDPGNPTSSLVYFAGILVATVLMLAAIKLGRQGVIRGVVLLTSAMLNWIVLTVLLARFLPFLPASPVAGVAAIGLAVLLYVYPEWYVIDVAGVVMGAGAAGLFGITFGVLPAILLLVVLAVYDAVSVYGTEHMLTLAENAMDMRIPVLFVVPTSLSYSFLDAGNPDVVGNGGSDGESPQQPGGDRIHDAGSDGESPQGSGGDGDRIHDGGPQEESSAGEPGTEASGDDATDGGPRGDDPPDEPAVFREALFIGLGDAVMPTILVVTAAFFLEVPRYDLPVLLNLPSLGALVGTLLGLAGLQFLVARGRVHAGLPLLNGGAIAGYLVGATLAGVPLVEALGIAGLI